MTLSLSCFFSVSYSFLEQETVREGVTLPHVQMYFFAFWQNYKPNIICVQVVYKPTFLSVFLPPAFLETKCYNIQQKYYLWLNMQDELVHSLLTCWFIMCHWEMKDRLFFLCVVLYLYHITITKGGIVRMAVMLSGGSAADHSELTTRSRSLPSLWGR